MARVFVPFENNQFYYNGLRGVLSSIVYSMIGVYITAIVTGEIGVKELVEIPLMAINIWIVACIYVWRKSYTTTSKVIFSLGPVWFFPRVAKVILALLYVIIGVFCSLMFEMFIKVRSSYMDIIPLFTFMFIFIVLLTCFSSLSISGFSEQKIEPDDSKKLAT